ncbi:MAG: hypothetical protein GY827_04665 [Cytophagales bacterium]|nr:hypothetical protein [Cytophagales bacterium]
MATKDKKISTRVIWQCGYCDDIAISYSTLRHDMNFCDCGKSALDLEEDYSRTIGEVKYLSVKDCIEKSNEHGDKYRVWQKSE